MKVLSLFNGMGCIWLALDRIGVTVTHRYSCEIDKYANKVNDANYPDTIQLGSVVDVKGSDLGYIDLLVGGSQCQGFSFAGKGLNFEDTRSKLFFEFVRIYHELREINPNIKFMLENVNMKKIHQDVISNILDTTPIKINSNLLSAQTRTRLYWVNSINIPIPEDLNIHLESVIEYGEVDRDKSYCIDANYFKGTSAVQYLCKSRRQVVWVIPEATKKGFVEVSNGMFIDLSFIKSKTRRGRLMIKKSNCLTASSFTYCKVTNDWFRILTPVECERLQTVPDNYTNHVSSTQRYKMLGNGWTVDVIAHILSHIAL